MAQDAVVPIRRALVSVFDKSGLDVLAKGLADAGVTIVSTGSTAEAVAEAGIAVTPVSAVTGFPEILDGRVKTLHPAVHAGILADRYKPAHLRALEEQGIAAIDLVVANLYPFARAAADPAVDDAGTVEMIDIGGPAMVRAAAKNHAGVAVVVDPSDYAALLADLRNLGGTTAARRRRLAAKAFSHTAAYDAAVADWMWQRAGGDADGMAAGDTSPARVAAAGALPDQLHLTYARTQTLRYGENPHQRAAWYVAGGRPWGLASARQLHGKELSYNNLLDTDAAWGLATDFTEPCIAIIKHTNPAGVAVAETLAAAYPPALAGDPVSAFGGIVAANRPIDAATAEQIVGVFTEVVVAPDFTQDALAILRTKASLRILAVEQPHPDAPALSLRSIAGGVLVQDADAAAADPGAWAVPTAAQPDAATLAELRFAWTVCKHAKSNAIVLSRDRAAVGVGAGQMSRVDSVRIAVEKSAGRAAGAVLASDAFFPFRDGPDAALDAGVRALISPGGSVRDEEIVAACDERGVPMVFTGRRHFRH